MVKKIAKWSALALLVFYVVTQPANAAGIVHSSLDGLEEAATGVGQFITGVAS